MSRENVEIVRRSLDAYSRRDIDALRTLNHPGLELDWSASGGSLAGVYRGIDEALRFYTEYYETFESTVIEPDRLVETGDLIVVPNVASSVVATGSRSPRGARSSSPFTIV